MINEIDLIKRGDLLVKWQDKYLKIKWGLFFLTPIEHGNVLTVL